MQLQSLMGLSHAGQTLGPKLNNAWVDSFGHFALFSCLGAGKGSPRRREGGEGNL